MKIGFFTDTYLPGTSGVDVSVENFRKNLEKLGQKVFVYAPYFPNYKDKNPRVFRFKALKILKKPETRISLPILSKKPFQFKKVLDLKLDVVHCHSPFTMGILGKYIASYQRIPLVYTHHTRYPEYARIYLKEKIFLPRLAQTWSRIFANQANIVIAPSFKIKKILRDFGVKKEILILPTGINLNLFKKSEKPGVHTEKRNKKRKELGISKEIKIFLFVGRISEEKNIDFLLKVLKIILNKRKDVVLMLVGEETNFTKKIKEKAESLKVRDFVRFIGSVPHQKMPDYYQSSDVFLFSSLTETQGIVVLEAMASGLPIVALKDEVFKDIILNNQNGFITKNFSPEIFSKKILKILDNSEIYKKFSVHSQKTAKNFSEKKQARKLLKIYQDLQDLSRRETLKNNIELSKSYSKFFYEV